MTSLAVLVRSFAALIENTKTKMIKGQMYGRAGFTLLRHRILLG